MKTLVTTLDAVEAIFQVLRGAMLDISGHIYRLQRPINSRNEDIVIIPVAPLTTDQMQRGVINVNIYIPNLDLTGDQTQPNINRFNEVSKEVLQALDEQNGYSYNFNTETAGDLVPSNIGWFMNIRVEFNAFRKDGMNPQNKKYWAFSQIINGGGGGGGEPSNQNPTANAGGDLEITLPTDTVQLLGTASDPDGAIESYLWSQVSGYAATIATPSNQNTIVSGLTEGSYVFRLTVTDNDGATDTDDVTVTVNVDPTPVITAESQILGEITVTLL